MRVARRDASFYTTHRCMDKTGAYSHVPVWHAVKPDDPNYSRCGRLVDSMSEQEHYGVLARCGRPGCRQAFALTEQEGNER